MLYSRSIRLCVIITCSRSIRLCVIITCSRSIRLCAIITCSRSIRLSRVCAMFSINKIVARLCAKFLFFKIILRCWKVKKFFVSYIFCISDYWARDFEKSEYIETNKCMYELYEEFRTIQKTPNIAWFGSIRLCVEVCMFSINNIVRVFSIKCVMVR